MVRLLLADDHALFRSGLVRLLETMGDYVVLAEAANASELMQALELHPETQLVLLDLTMPGNNGVEIVKDVVSRYPDIPILVVSMCNESAMVTAALRAGAKGYVSKGCDMKVLQKALGKVARHEHYLEPALQQAIDDRNVRGAGSRYGGLLSLREEQVLALILEGIRLSSIAEMLFISSKTVSAHKRQIMHKLGVSNDVDLYRHTKELNYQN